MIKSNHSLLKCEQESALEFRLYMLVALTIIIKLITMFILLLTTWNSTLIDHASVQKTSWAFSQDKFRTEIYYTSNWQFLNQENCWYVSRSFIFICFKLKSTLSYFYWIRFLFYDWFNLYFVH